MTPEEWKIKREKELKSVGYVIDNQTFLYSSIERIGGLHLIREGKNIYGRFNIYFKSGKAFTVERSVATRYHHITKKNWFGFSKNVKVPYKLDEYFSDMNNEVIEIEKTIIIKSMIKHER
jgi:hypothetical protein